jgi:hypothetical protein
VVGSPLSWPDSVPPSAMGEGAAACLLATASPAIRSPQPCGSVYGCTVPGARRAARALRAANGTHAVLTLAQLTESRLDNRLPRIFSNSVTDYVRYAKRCADRDRSLRPPRGTAPDGYREPWDALSGHLVPI